MLAAPAATYSGGFAGYNATAPQHGSKIDADAPDTVRYVGYLKREARRNSSEGSRWRDGLRLSNELQWLCGQTHNGTHANSPAHSRQG
jgi:hypothetical protein